MGAGLAGSGHERRTDDRESVDAGVQKMLTSEVSARALPAGDGLCDLRARSLRSI